MRGRYDSQVTMLAYIDLETRGPGNARTWKRGCQRIIPCVLSRCWRTKP